MTVLHACMMVALLLGVAGCRDEGAKATPVASSSSKTSAPAGAAGEDTPTVDDEVETVDDTIPGEGDAVDPADGAEEAPDDDPEEGCAPKEDGLEPMQLLKFTWASGIEGKDPKDKLYVARPGQRIYAHLRMRNRSGKKRCLKLVFRVGDKKRTEVTLEIGKSWNWRTWAYNTVKREDREPLRLTIHDDQGALVLDERLPVVPESK